MMLIGDAQREIRAVYRGGSVGQLVSGLIWLASAAVATFVDAPTGFWALTIGGAAIFPTTRAVLWLAGGRGGVSRDNPLNGLAVQVAFTVPLVLPLAGAAAMHRMGWFYPACLIIVGAHYLPFVFLYGMKTFAALAAAFLGAGFAIGLGAADRVTLGGWVGGMILLAFAPALLVASGKGPAVGVPTSA